MIKVESVDVWGFEHAIRAVRNPRNSWDKSDSKWKYDREITTYGDNVDLTVYAYEIGQNDLSLMQRLYKSGPEHRTYARMIQCSMDITAPLYWWKEMDRYTVGKSQVSCSTMHKIAAKEFDINDFSHDYLEELKDDDYNYAWQDWIDRIKCLNYFRDKYNSTKDKRYWRMMIEKLPSSYNQRRTVGMSYEVIFKIINERTGHKLDEWNEFCRILKELPYVTEIMEEESNEN